MGGEQAASPELADVAELLVVVLAAAAVAKAEQVPSPAVAVFAIDADNELALDVHSEQQGEEGLEQIVLVLSQEALPRVPELALVHLVVLLEAEPRGKTVDSAWHHSVQEGEHPLPMWAPWRLEYRP